ncbi:MAG: amino acid/polyamine/organocation transporter, superfamily [Candidatus Angelobacter sp.]|jgi:APA family basic amino acid/polyamine antiporter|nr:amino acid/polyamine/organocation transporter, superfamily [Candidatus Angelobacter sp.]
MNQQNSAPAAAADASTKLVRGLSLKSATALNMIDMIGVGPFITIPLIISAMGGPQAMLGWIFGAVLAICDGLVWAELGAAMPGSGGSYFYLKNIYGAKTVGRLLSFLFIWQLSFSAPLSIASGCIGLSRYAAYIFPSLDHVWSSHVLKLAIPLLGDLEVNWIISNGTFVAIGAVLLAVFLLYRKITIIGRFSIVLWIGVLATIAWVIFAGVTHFNAARAFDFPPNAFHLDHAFFTGLGAALLVSTYDYWGYYNVCFLGEEVENPGKNIPRALLISIVAVGAIYIVMNISILGVLPWRELADSAKTDTRFYIMSTFMQRIYGAWAGYLITALIIWTAFASVFSLLLGYSRVPYAAALDGNYFKAFARVHPEHHFPNVSLMWLGLVAAAFCFLRLADVIAALVVIRLTIQFLTQSIGLILLRLRQPDLVRPFRMYLYPLPALLAIAGYIFVLISRPNFQKEIRYAALLIVTGTIIYLVRSWRNQEWPFANKPAH